MNAPLDFFPSGAQPSDKKKEGHLDSYLRQRLEGRVFLIFAKPGMLTNIALSSWKKKMGLSDHEGVTAHVIDPDYPMDRILAWSYHAIFQPGDEYLLFREKQYLDAYLRGLDPKAPQLIRFAYRSLSDVNWELLFAKT